MPWSLQVIVEDKVVLAVGGIPCQPKLRTRGWREKGSGAVHNHLPLTGALSPSTVDRKRVTRN